MLREFWLFWWDLVVLGGLGFAGPFQLSTVRAHHQHHWHPKTCTGGQEGWGCSGFGEEFVKENVLCIEVWDFGWTLD